MDSFKGKTDVEITQEIGSMASAGFSEEAILAALSRDGIDPSTHAEQVSNACLIHESFERRDQARIRRGGLTNLDIFKYIDRFGWDMKKPDLVKAFDFMKKELHNQLDDGDLLGFKEETTTANIYIIMRIKLTFLTNHLVFFQLLFNTKCQEVGNAISDLEGTYNFTSTANIL